MRYFMIHYNTEVGGFFGGDDNIFKQFENIDDIPWDEFFRKTDIEMNENTKARFFRNGSLFIDDINDSKGGIFLFDFEHRYSKREESNVGKGLWNHIDTDSILVNKYKTLSEQIRNYIREEKIKNLI